VFENNQEGKIQFENQLITQMLEQMHSLR